jgi:hypothetical protein
MTFIPEHADDLEPERLERLDRDAERTRDTHLHQLDQDVRHSPAPEASPDVQRRVRATSTLQGLVTEVERTAEFLRDVDTPVAEAARARLEVALERPREVLDASRFWI